MSDLRSTETIDEWEPSTDLEKIAVAIGHHFWKCKDNREARWCGDDAARDVMKALNR